MLDQKDIETLEVFAYNRLIVRRFAEALSVYQLLSQLESKKHKWQLASLLCLWHLGSAATATAIASDTLTSLAKASLAPTEKALFSKLSYVINHT